MRWEKFGSIFNSNKQNFWMNSHASVPIVDHIDKNLYKVYFSSRDVQNRSYVGSFEFDITTPKKIFSISKKPILSPGKDGTFDDSGTMCSCIVSVKNKKYLYYIGWNKGVSVPYRNSIGLAISNNNGKTFEKISEGPIIDRTYKEPHFAASSYVLKEKNEWKMWYLSCIKWALKKNQLTPFYHIKYAKSSDGINWNRDGTVCIDFKNRNEWAISRPFVWKEKDLYKMTYSYRGKNPYKIGYAESRDGINWNRKDSKIGIKTSQKGWDSKMIEYAFLVNHNGIQYMFYNGNEYGKTGIGLAKLVN